MIHPALKGKKMVFDVKGKPELREAIIQRIKELGGRWYSDRNNEFICPPETKTLLWSDDFLLRNSEASATHTLSDLYDLKPPPLQLEVGKWYRRRDGNAVGPMRISDPAEPAGWCLPFNDGVNSYAANGGWYPNEGIQDYDLIEEVTHLPITLADGTIVEIPVAEHERLRGVK